MVFAGIGEVGPIGIEVLAAAGPVVLLEFVDTGLGGVAVHDVGGLMGLAAERLP